MVFRFFVVIIFFSSCSLSFGQTTSDIKDANFLKAQDLKVKLGINLDKSFVLENILNSFNLRLRKLVLDSRESDKNFGAQLKDLQAMRDKKLRALLDDQQMKLFVLLEKSEIQDIKDYYFNLDSTILHNEEFAKSLSLYYNNNQSPVILRHKSLLNQEINENDSLELIELRVAFNEILDDAIGSSNENIIRLSDLKLGKVIKTLGKEKPSYTEVWNRIKKLSKRYREDIKKEYSGIDYHTKEWNIDMKNFFNEYVEEDNTVIENQMFFTLTQYGVSEKINRYVFLLFDVNDINTYFEMKHKIQKLLIEVSK